MAREDVLHVPIPIVKGLSGFRVMLIRDGEQERFNLLAKEGTLKDTRIGQGHGWIDVNIYADNGIRVTTSPHFQSLFSMLSKGRFDALPIGADMVLNHFESSHEHVNNLAIEESFLIYYPMPVYIFVSKKFPKLAVRIEYGLRQLIKSGEMDKIFQEHYGEIIDRLQLNKRRMFILENKYLIPDVPLHDKEMWFRGDVLSLKYQKKEN